MLALLHSPQFLQCDSTTWIACKRAPSAAGQYSARGTFSFPRKATSVGFTNRRQQASAPTGSASLWSANRSDDANKSNVIAAGASSSVTNIGFSNGCHLAVNHFVRNGTRIGRALHCSQITTHLCDYVGNPRKHRLTNHFTFAACICREERGRPWQPQALPQPSGALAAIMQERRGKQTRTDSRIASSRIDRQPKGYGGACARSLDRFDVTRPGLFDGTGRGADRADTHQRASRGSVRPLAPIPAHGSHP